MGEVVPKVEGGGNFHQDGAAHVSACQDINLTAGLAGAGAYSADNNLYQDCEMHESASQGGQQQLATLGQATDGGLTK